MNYRLQNAPRAFHANTWILCDKSASIVLRLKFFDAMVTSVACFAAFCSWSPESVCGSVTRAGCTLPEIATALGWTRSEV